MICSERLWHSWFPFSCYPLLHGIAPIRAIKYTIGFLVIFLNRNASLKLFYPPSPTLPTAQVVFCVFLALVLPKVSQ